jgi:hypothetical protein
MRRAEPWVDETVGDGTVVDGAGCGDEVLCGMPALAGVAADDGGGGAGAVEGFRQLFNIISPTTVLPPPVFILTSRSDSNLDLQPPPTGPRH